MCYTDAEIKQGEECHREAFGPGFHFPSQQQVTLHLPQTGQEPLDLWFEQQQHVLRQGKVGEDPQCWLTDRKDEAIGMPCHCPTGTSHPWHVQKPDKMRNIVHRNLGKRNLKDARQRQRLLSSANSAKHPLYHQAGHSWAGLGGYL